MGHGLQNTFEIISNNFNKNFFPKTRIIIIVTFGTESMEDFRYNEQYATESR